MMEQDKRTLLVRMIDTAAQRWEDINCGPNDSSPESLAAIAHAACQATLQLERIADALEAIANTRREKEQS
jgi:hypothetical protein